MKKTILLYGVLGGVLITILTLIEYRFLIVTHSFEIYGALVALVFASAGIWLGLRLTQARERVVIQKVAVPIPADPFQVNQESIERMGITPRELEILKLIAEGLSTREIAERVFVSENTVKTHSARLFEKLNARRRTQAVLLAQQAGIIP